MRRMRCLRMELHDMNAIGRRNWRKKKCGIGWKKITVAQNGQRMSPAACACHCRWRQQWHELVVRRGTRVALANACCLVRLRRIRWRRTISLFLPEHHLVVCPRSCNLCCIHHPCCWYARARHHCAGMWRSLPITRKSWSFLIWMDN